VTQRIATFIILNSVFALQFRTLSFLGENPVQNRPLHPLEKALFDIINDDKLEKKIRLEKLEFITTLIEKEQNDAYIRIENLKKQVKDKTGFEYSRTEWEERMLEIAIYTQDNQGKTIFHLAAAKGYTEELLLLNAKDNKIAWEGCCYDADKNTPLALAAKHNHPHCVQALANFYSDTDKAKALRLAAEYGHELCVDSLLQAKASAYIVDNTTYESPMSISAKNGHVACVRTLLNAEAPPGLEDAIFFASANNQFICLDVLLGHLENWLITLPAESRNQARFAKINHRGFAIKIRNHASPLLAAARQGYEFCVASLVNAQASLNIQEIGLGGRHLGDTPVITAVRSNNKNCVRILLDAGADIHQKSWIYGETINQYIAVNALSIAIENNNPSMAALLVDYGATSESDKFNTWLSSTNEQTRMYAAFCLAVITTPQDKQSAKDYFEYSLEYPPALRRCGMIYEEENSHAIALSYYEKALAIGDRLGATQAISLIQKQPDDISNILRPYLPFINFSQYLTSSQWDLLAVIALTQCEDKESGIIFAIQAANKAQATATSDAEKEGKTYLTTYSIFKNMANDQKYHQSLTAQFTSKTAKIITEYCGPSHGELLNEIESSLISHVMK
jgi:ankyrin repeat protein